MSDTWQDINALKQRQTNLRERLQRRRQQRIALEAAASDSPTDAVAASVDDPAKKPEAAPEPQSKSQQPAPSLKVSPLVERVLIRALCDLHTFPVDVSDVQKKVEKLVPSHKVERAAVCELLRKLSLQDLLSLSEESGAGEESTMRITSAELDKLSAMAKLEVKKSSAALEATVVSSRKRHHASQVSDDQMPASKRVKTESKDATLDVLSLLSASSVKEEENKKLGQEISELLSTTSAKERSLAEKFKSQGGTRLKEFCSHGTKTECRKQRNSSLACSKLHFRRLIRPHTDESLGDCSFLNTCFHVDTCKFVHYEVDYSVDAPDPKDRRGSSSGGPGGDAQLVTASLDMPEHKLYPPQWICCDMRTLDMNVLGKFSVVMADPPWDIHMELPYGTMSDEEMLRLDVPALQDEGYIFLWVTGRAMELGRQCLEQWGYERCDELIWVKTNQLQRLIRTGRTGHWLNHGKEHCLIGVKGTPGKHFKFNRGLDCDVLVAEVRETSHKPDEVYGMIERLCPGARKVELFGRQHNAQPNWVTLGNQLDGVHLLDPDVVARFKQRYPNGLQNVAA